MAMIYNEDICNGEAARLIGVNEVSQKRRFKILLKAYQQHDIRYADFPSIPANQCYNDCQLMVKKKLLCRINKKFHRAEHEFALTNWGEHIIKKAYKVIYPVAAKNNRDIWK